MCTRGDCVKNMGKWVHFQTPWGTHRGIVSGINHQAVLVRVPRQYAPVGLASESKTLDEADEKKLDLVLTQWGGYGYGGYGVNGGYGGAYNGAYAGRGWGRPGYGGWYGGWWWWWLAFAWIFWLAFLW